MAKRIGKYKVGKKESELSIADGGTITGALTATSTVTLSGITEGAGGSLTSNQLYYTSSQAVTGSADALNVLVLGA
jgi:hypothetical protein